MSSGTPHSGAGGEGPEPTVSQTVHAADRARVLVAGSNQYIVTPGNAFWVTVPVLLVFVSFLIYLAVGRTPSASGSPPASGHGQHAQQAVPLTVTLSYDQNHVDNGAPNCSIDWIAAQPIASIKPPPVGELDETYAHQLGGIDEGGTNFKLDVQGATPTAVELIGFRVVDIDRMPVRKGTAFLSHRGCGPSPEAGFAIGLGGHPPAIAPVAGLDGKAAKKIPFPFVVSSTDIQQFQIAAVYSQSSATASCNCLIRWRLALDWSYEGRAGTTLIDDSGKPFQTIFLAPRSSVLATPWWDNDGVWRRA
jgi:hypothetical protein